MHAENTAKFWVKHKGAIVDYFEEIELWQNYNVNGNFRGSRSLR
jgi:hypothetical protein